MVSVKLQWLVDGIDFAEEVDQKMTEKGLPGPEKLILFGGISGVIDKLGRSDSSSLIRRVFHYARNTVEGDIAVGGYLAALIASIVQVAAPKYYSGKVGTALVDICLMSDLSISDTNKILSTAKSNGWL